MNEKSVWKGIKHPFIVELVDTFQNDLYLFMVLQFVSSGDLYYYIKKLKCFSEMHARFYVCEIASALGYLHAMNVMHRDLKPENILLENSGHIRFTDFGFAKKTTHETKSFCGTPEYIAPEIILDFPYNKSVDWWSLGVLTYEMISGATPFKDDTANKIYSNICNRRIVWPSLIDGDAQDFIDKLLEMSPQRRLGASRDIKEIQAHEWFRGVDWKVVDSRGLKPPMIPVTKPLDIVEREAGEKENHAIESGNLEGIVADWNTFFSTECAEMEDLVKSTDQDLFKDF